MTKFEALFGVKQTQIKKNCILLPFVPKGLLSEFKIKGLFRGKLYSTASVNNVSFIHTGMSAGLVGDAVLYLEKSPCKNVFLLGSCGLVKKARGLDVASIVSPAVSFSNESFSQTLVEKKVNDEAYYPHEKLLGEFLRKNPDIPKVTCLTMSSLKLEEQMHGLLLKKRIEVVDMESSAFFLAAKYVGLKAVAVFCISDIIKKKPFYANLEPDLRNKITSATIRASKLLCEFLKTNPSV